MRRALTKALGAALIVLALTAARRSHATDGRPVVRIVLVTNADAPSWFDGFVKHLERELGLRGIDVIASRGARAGGAASPPSGTAGTAYAELVVETPAAMRPVLRFTAPRDPSVTSEPSSAGRVRQVNLAGVPADGFALALAAAADELMRSNWPRAAPVEASRPSPAEAKPSPNADAAPTAVAKGDGQAAATAQTANETPRVTAASASSGDADVRIDPSEQDAVASTPGGGLRSRIGAAGAGEAFGGGQMQLGADLRWAVRVLPRFDVEVRGGWRTILRRETTHGAVDGNALLAGGAFGVVVLRTPRLDLAVVGRGDLVRVAYRGDARDTGVIATSGDAFGLMVSAGPRASLALTRSIALEGEVAAGASLLATTATDAGSDVFSTKGAAFLAGLGLSLGL